MSPGKSRGFRASWLSLTVPTPLWCFPRLNSETYSPTHFESLVTRKRKNLCADSYTPSFPCVEKTMLYAKLEAWPKII
jgi:hypothetical protein